MDDEDSSDVSVVWECLVREDVKEVFTCVRHSSRITSDVGSTASDGSPPPTHLNTGTIHTVRGMRSELVAVSRMATEPDT